MTERAPRTGAGDPATTHVHTEQATPHSPDGVLAVHPRAGAEAALVEHGVAAEQAVAAAEIAVVSAEMALDVLERRLALVTASVASLRAAGGAAGGKRVTASAAASTAAAASSCKRQALPEGMSAWVGVDDVRNALHCSRSKAHEYLRAASGRRAGTGELLRVPVDVWEAWAREHLIEPGRRKRWDGDRTIERELEVLVMALAYAKSCGRWSGDPRSIIPLDFKPPAAKRGDSISRAEALRIFPLLVADSAAAMAFSLATGAEMAALRNARRTDIPDDLAACRRLWVRGTKNEAREAFVPVVTDEQRTLLSFVSKHARGTEDRLFGELHNFARDLRGACRAEGITLVSPHDIRRSAGQWMIDLGAPLELVSLFLRHRDIGTTQRWYAQVRDEDVADRLLDSLDPRLAEQAHKARGEKKLVETLREVPEPRGAHATYEVAGVIKSLDAWARHAGIPKTTLYYRVVVCGRSMSEALATGRSARKHVRGRVAAEGADCERIVKESADGAGGKPEKNRAKGLSGTVKQV